MQRRNVPWRRLAFALAIPVVAVGGIVLTAGVAASSTGAATAVKTEQPNQPNQPVNPNVTGNPNIPNLPQGTNPQIPRTLRTIPPTTGKTASPTKSPTTSPTKSPTATPSGRVSISPSPSPVPGGGTTTVPVPVIVPGIGGAPGACQTPMSPPVTVQIGTVGGKQALVNQAGCALYLFNKDTATTSACDANCLQLWHPVPGPAQPGSGVDQAKLNVFNRTDGTVQATYGGHQLYTFAGDNQPGDANGQNVRQSFFLVDANGNPITS
jgi:predicted lipoprotein with Yx(FWY)xxD motif